MFILNKSVELLLKSEPCLYRISVLSNFSIFISIGSSDSRWWGKSKHFMHFLCKISSFNAPKSILMSPWMHFLSHQKIARDFPIFNPQRILFIFIFLSFFSLLLAYRDFLFPWFAFHSADTKDPSLNGEIVFKIFKTGWIP